MVQEIFDQNLINMFTTLDDLKKGSKKEEEKKGKKTSSYTGGSKSGMEVENPVEDIVR